ncbi:MazG-like family protein [Thalassospira profundimaris]|uniref:MazG-like family protein n=1 Tax=Thalassospira profundimaris TaxID=502049 RepID=UPI0002871CF4|nr:MazG-like family protein [Thalassospira profundimaris]EKF08659.1 MazG nucleotide pyrophosphohydrolase [Thalassospira profundimaris WP0211]
MLCESNNESSENQRSMCDWAEQTFGPVSDPASLVERALLEMQELGEAVQDRDISEIGKEAADVLILLYRLADQFNLDLDQEVQAKMAINRSRTWVSKGDGTGSHV